MDFNFIDDDQNQQRKCFDFIEERYQIVQEFGFKTFLIYFLFKFIEQETLEEDINRMRKENKKLVKRHRDLEQDTPLKGFDLEPMSAKETAALRSSLPHF